MYLTSSEGFQNGLIREYVSWNLSQTSQSSEQTPTHITKRPRPPFHSLLQKRGGKSGGMPGQRDGCVQGARPVVRQLTGSNGGNVFDGSSVKGIQRNIRAFLLKGWMFSLSLSTSQASLSSKTPMFLGSFL